MSAHLPQPAQCTASYTDASAYLGVAYSSSLQHQAHHMDNSPPHFPHVQRPASLSYRQQFVAQQLVKSPTVSMPASGAQSEMDGDELNKYKEAIYAHPLFSLLELLLQKCELATTTCSEQGKDGSPDYTRQTVNDEISAFAEKIQCSVPYYSPRPDVDTFMVQAVQTLRFHLMELEKVHELCHSFCERYVSCLKGKMPMDLAISSERDFSTLASTSTTLAAEESAVSSERLTGQDEASPDFLTDQQMLGSGTPTTPSDGGMQDSGPFEFGGIVVESSRALTSSSETASASGITTMTVGHDQRTASISGTGSDMSHECADEVLAKDKSKTKKRGIFPKSATNVMKAWLFQHLAHPYPSEDQKRQLSQETGLTILQVNNWFINARRRIVQPMIDASNRAGSPSGMSMTGIPHLPPAHSIATSPSIPINRDEQFMAPTMMPQAAIPHHAVMPMTNLQPPLRQDSNAHLPLTHLPPMHPHLPPLHLPHQGMVSGQPGMIHAAMSPPAMPQAAYPGMMPEHALAPQSMCVPCPQSQPMQPPALAMMPPPQQAVPLNTMISPTHTVTAPSGALVPLPAMHQLGAQHNVIPQGYHVVASSPHLTYYSDHATMMVEHPQQQQ
ncbi:homeobox protein Meis3-like isoform X2 [Corticium candelabrum]|uniref:homeobox protein Meis3-like isoform X2 n=1 Tax=Corticium candelabrum TaxID=121492 RepID=UPI002E268DFF|nr:homeobox protein Meis3-like isoform X2 [Corticium candelabrum]